MKRLYLFLTVKCLCVLFLFAVAGISCSKEDDPGKQEGGIQIENLQTRLRIVVSPSVGSDVEHVWRDRKSTRLNSSHARISYAVFCLKKKKLDS